MEDIKKSLLKTIELQERLIKILENHTTRIQNLEEFAWKLSKSKKK